MSDPKPKPKRAKYNVTPERFIEVWQASANAREAAAVLGMPVLILHARATHYRRLGIKLKSMPRVPRAERIDPAALNRKFGLGP